jgi:hypothetical protein
MFAYCLPLQHARRCLSPGPCRPSPLDRAVAGAKLRIQRAVDFNRIEAPSTEQQFDAFADVIWTAPP